ncbi:MAG TPA: MAPEG family protein [Hyphomicrobiaceae bacterium]|nr:MAPEG family protein [Hyphomicrobiaceae bacterium]
MSPDLTFLIWSVVLTFVQVVICATAATMAVGLPQLAGNRENMSANLEGWGGRAVRAHRNMLESLVLFATLVLVAHVSGKANAMTAFGAQLFFFARLAYAVIYIAGVPWLRTGVWAASIVGMGLILMQLL